jgi:hypothetical protein
MFSVYQHWDPLKVCAVGRSYPPEFYSFIENSEILKFIDEDPNKKYVKYVEEYWLDKDVWHGVQLKNKR